MAGRRCSHPGKSRHGAARKHHLASSVGPRWCVANQLQPEADVIRAMHERVQLCQGPQVESDLIRESLSVSRVTHICPSARAHDPGRGKRSQKNFDEVGLGVTGRGSFQAEFTEDCLEQATALRSVGSRCTRSVDVARLAHSGAVVAARPRRRVMTRDTSSAGLLGAEPLLERLDRMVDDSSLLQNS